MEIAFMILLLALAASFVVTIYLLGVIDRYAFHMRTMCENCPIRKEFEEKKAHNG